MVCVVSTGQASLADLCFNNGSVARIGEQAVFEFWPQTRDSTLYNGTVLLLIPPGRDQTQINTPNAGAAIRGSALFVRYNRESETTVIGELTNRRIQVVNKESSQSLVLQAGKLMVVVKGEFQGLYDFDLRHFHENSNLVRGFDLIKQNSSPLPDPELASVQAQTAAAVATQKPIMGQGAINNPSFLRRSSNARGSNKNSNKNYNKNSNNRDFGREQKLINRPLRDNLERGSNVGNLRGPLDLFIRNGDIIRENRRNNHPGQGRGNQVRGNQVCANQGGSNSNNQ
jgi:acrosin